MQGLPSFEQINDSFSYDPVSGIITWKHRPLVRRCINTKFAGKQAGSLHVSGYVHVAITINSKSWQLKHHRVAWILMMGHWPETDIDHKDGIRSNNIWSNLRLATRTQNNANSAGYAVSGFKGVCLDKKTNRWRANICFNRKCRSLGAFDTPEEASKAYCAESERLHGEFASHLCR